MGKVYLNSENKLIVHTDNGIINPDGTSSAEIKSSEPYSINIEDIAALLKIVNNQDTNTRTVVINLNPFSRCKIVSNKDIISEVEDFVSGIKERNNKLSIENEKLRKKISEYNSNKKIFWRPIDIDDL